MVTLANDDIIFANDISSPMRLMKTTDDGYKSRKSESLFRFFLRNNSTEVLLTSVRIKM